MIAIQIDRAEQGKEFMCPILLQPKYQISEKDFEILKNNIKSALEKLDHNDLCKIYLIEENALIISFDGEWFPFIGFTHGFNPEDNRVHLATNLFVLNICADSLKNKGRDIPGGRVFITNEYAFIKEFDKKCVICTWNFQGHDIVGDIKEILDEEINNKLIIQLKELLKNITA